MTFQLDTSGGVQLTDTKWVRIVQWSDLDPFTQGYIGALFDGAYHAGAFAVAIKARRRDLHLPGFSDLAPETLARIMEDCAAFRNGPRAWVDTKVAGHVWWADRQRGRWADSFPPLTPVLSDDGKVRFADQIAARPLAVAHG